MWAVVMQEGFCSRSWASKCILWPKSNPKLLKDTTKDWYSYFLHMTATLSSLAFPFHFSIVATLASDFFEKWFSDLWVWIFSGPKSKLKSTDETIFSIWVPFWNWANLHQPCCDQLRLLGSCTSWVPQWRQFMRRIMWQLVSTGLHVCLGINAYNDKILFCVLFSLH